MNIAYKGEKLCYFDTATGKYLDPETLEEVREAKKVEEPVVEAVEEPAVETKSNKKIK